MILEFLDWRFRVDLAATERHTTKNASDHCLCAYCRNYYEAIDREYPEVVSFLLQFGVNAHGPSELMPFTPTLVLARYRVTGEILAWGSTAISLSGILVTPELSEDGTFLLWIGEMHLPWLQKVAMEDVVSPANLPEFMERMQEVWSLRHGETLLYS